MTEASKTRTAVLIAAGVVVVGLVALVWILTDDDDGELESADPTAASAPASAAPTADGTSTTTTTTTTTVTTTPVTTTTPATSTTSAPSTSRDGGTEGSSDDLRDAVDRLRRDLPYAEAREILLDAGWNAVEGRPDAERPGLVEHLSRDLGYREVQDCSGTGLGLCLMRFATPEGDQLLVSTTNNEEGVEGGPVVYSWTSEGTGAGTWRP